MTITDTGACPGVIPAMPSCAAQLTLCSGSSTGANGPSGTVARGAVIDDKGALALGCHRLDSGPSESFSLYLPMPSGYVSKAPLGYEVSSTGAGFVSNSVYAGAPEWDFRAHDGSILASVKTPGRLYAGAKGVVAITVVQQDGDALLTAQGYGADGTPRGPAIAIATSAGASAGSVMLGGAAATDGRTLVTWQVYGQSGATAIWVNGDGTPASASFAVDGWMDHGPDAAALPGGAIALPTASPDAYGPMWRGVVAAGATSESPAPSWLVSRRRFVLLKDTALWFGSEVLAADGTSCGTVILGSGVVGGVGADGTTVTPWDEKTFRIYPQLFR